jgi:acetyl esterase/lipase
MKSLKDIPYALEYGKSGLLDLHVPAGAINRPVVIVIHGGALREFSKERMEGIANWITEQGWVAVNINYRLLPDHPYPASLEDSLAACRWVRAGNHEELQQHDLGRVALLGASAGGFLALVAGFILGLQHVRAIVSISGPTQPGWYGKDATRERHAPRLFCAPTELVGPDAPPILAVHSRNDKLVAPEESAAIVERMQSAGRSARLYLFDGPGEQHGIWRNTQEPLYLFPHIEDAIADFLRETL